MVHLATQTASMANANIPVKNIEKGSVMVPFYYNSGSTAFSATAATVLLCKIPNGATVLDVTVCHSSGGNTCPGDYGYSITNSAGTVSATLSCFISALAKGTWSRATVTPSNVAFASGVPTKLSNSDDAGQRFYYLTGSYAPGTATASMIVQGYVTYTMDGIIPM